MEIDLSKLNNRIEIDKDINIDLNKYQYKDIKDLSNLHVLGSIEYNSSDNLKFDLNLTGNMVLIDAISLEDINYPLDLKITDEYEINDEFMQVYMKNNKNILDIIPILWENIVLEVPISLTTQDNVKLSGDGWSLNEDNNNDDIDPRLAKLQEVLDRKE